MIRRLLDELAMKIGIAINKMRSLSHSDGSLGAADRPRAWNNDESSEYNSGSRAQNLPFIVVDKCDIDRSELNYKGSSSKYDFTIRNRKLSPSHE